MMLNETLTTLAHAIAKHAHCGQKYGEHDYYEYHVLGVANGFSYGSDLYITALLHDVVEDSSVLSKTILNLFGEKIYNSIICLTKQGGVQYDYYIHFLSGNPMARKVKIADLKFHLSQPVLKNERKYKEALEWLMDVEA